MPKSVLTPDARKRLPRLYKQQTARDPLIYAKLSARNQKWECYVAEGGTKADEYQIFALFVGQYGHTWIQIPLQAMERNIEDAHLKVVENIEFKPVRVSKLVGEDFVRPLR